MTTTPGHDCDPEQASVSGSSAPSSGQSQYPSFTQSAGMSCMTPAVHPEAHFNAATKENEVVVEVTIRRTSSKLLFHKATAPTIPSNLCSTGVIGAFGNSGSPKLFYPRDDTRNSQQTNTNCDRCQDLSSVINCRCLTVRERVK
jgi:hypothetical protein